MISRSGTRRSGAASGIAKILREEGSGPVVTLGVSNSDEAKGLFIGSPPKTSGDPGGAILGLVNPSLRRHDPDQVQRVTAVPFGIAVSQPVPGLPSERTPL